GRSARAAPAGGGGALVPVDGGGGGPGAVREKVMNYSDYRHLTFEPRPNGVLLVTINRPEVLNAANARLHWEFGQIWLTVDADPKTRVVVVTGAGKAFSAGGDLALIDDMAGNPEALSQTLRAACD